MALPGETPAGTVFEAVATKDGVETKVRTRPWQGRAALATPPTLEGEAGVGKTVTATTGTWQGGWGPTAGAAAYSGIFACDQPTGGDCWLIEYGTTATPQPLWAGWYLFASTPLYLGNTVCNAVLGCHVSGSRAAPPVHVAPPQGATFARSAPLGPIAAAPSARPEAKAPVVTIRSHALRVKGHLRIARVRCERRCVVQLKVSGGDRRAENRGFIVTGSMELAVPLRRGKLQVSVVVDRKLVASGRSRAL